LAESSAFSTKGNLPGACGFAEAWHKLAHLRIASCLPDEKALMENHLLNIVIVFGIAVLSPVLLELNRWFRLPAVLFELSFGE